MNEGEKRRRPGEMAFSALMLLVSLFVLWSAYGIAGFRALSSPGALPMAAGTVMVIASTVTLLRDARRPPATDRRGFFVAIVPPVLGVFIALVAAFGILFESAGFLVSAGGFLFMSIWYLHRRGAVPALLLTAIALAGVYVVFRVIFTVLLPEGIVPEREIGAGLRGWIRLAL